MERFSIQLLPGDVTMLKIKESNGCVSVCRRETPSGGNFGILALMIIYMHKNLYNTLQGSENPKGIKRASLMSLTFDLVMFYSSEMIFPGFISSPNTDIKWLNNTVISDDACYILLYIVY